MRVTWNFAFLPPIQSYLVIFMSWPTSTGWKPTVRFVRVLSVWGGVGWVITLVSTSSLAWCCAATCCLALRCMLPLIQGFAGTTNCGKPPESKEKILEVKGFDCISQLHSRQKNTCLLRCKVLPGNRISPQIYARCMLFSKNILQTKTEGMLVARSHVLDSHRRHQCLLGNVEKYFAFSIANLQKWFNPDWIAGYGNMFAHGNGMQWRWAQIWGLFYPSKKLGVFLAKI